MVLLVSPRLEAMLREAQRTSGTPYWDRLMEMDISVPILVSSSMDEGLWRGRYRDDLEAIFAALTEKGWTN